MSKKQWILGAALLLTSGSLLAGCYTVLRHPQVEMQYDEGASDCASCHADADLYHFRDPFMDPYGYYDYGVTRWYGYYGVPWWYDRYYYYPGTYRGDGRNDDDRQVWGRGGATTPVPRVGTAPSLPRVNAPATETNREDRKDDDGKDRKSDKKKKRRLWGRGG